MPDTLGGALNNVEPEVSLDAHSHLLIAAPGLTWAQGVCPLNGTGSRKLICMLPQALGSSGFNYALFGILNNRPFPNIRPITQAVGTRLSQLPIASPSSDQRHL
jgi:hypothetical protein